MGKEGLNVKKIVALDIGNRRIGVAISDPFGEYAIPCDTYIRTGNFGEDIKSVAHIAKEKGAQLLVCGMPINADGSPSAQTKQTKKFIEILKKETNIPIYEEDERYTTIEAHASQQSFGVGRRESKKTVDSIAASYILDSFLKRIKQAKKEEQKMKKEERAIQESEEEHIISLIDDEGNEVEYYHIATLPYKGQTYCFFQKAEPETEEEEDEVVIYRLDEDDKGQELVPLDDDALMDEVFAEFCKEYEAYENSDEAAKLDGAD